jgi:hypothetical protein
MAVADMVRKRRRRRAWIRKRSGNRSYRDGFLASVEVAADQGGLLGESFRGFDDDIEKLLYPLQRNQLSSRRGA